MSITIEIPASECASEITSTAANLDKALENIERDKAGILPTFLTSAELQALMTAWTELFHTPGVTLDNQRFIIDPRLYDVAAFARLTTHPIIQDAVRRVIGDFQLAGFSVVATPPNGTEPSTAQNVIFHIDHGVYSDVPVREARDTFVCVWVNFEELAIENGPFVIAEGSHHFNMGYPETTAKFGRKVAPAGEIGWDHLARFNIGPAGMTAVYSGKTWHSATTNCSNKIRKGLNMNFVPSPARDSTKRNPFDICSLDPERYARLEETIGIPGYLIPWDGSPGQEVTT